MNLPQNINWLGLLGLAISLLGFFGIHITDAQQAILTTWLPQIVTGVTGLVSAATIIYHTFINHPANKAKAVALIKEAYDAGTAKLPNPHRTLPIIFALILLPSLVLGGCAALQNWFANGSGPIGDGLTVISGAQGAYLGLCPAGSSTSYCLSSKAEAKTISAAVTLTATQLVNAYETGGNVTQLETQLLQDITQWQNFVNSLNSKSGRKAFGVTDVVTILGVLIPVAQNVYEAIIGAAGNYTTAQLNALITTIQQQNASIQAS